MNKKFLIFANPDEVSVKITNEVTFKMEAIGWSRTEDDSSADLIFCIGGDGALLRLLRRYSFPETPIVGINTGHLGFFQEISVDGIDEFIELFKKGDYHIQEYIGLSAEIHTEDEVKSYVAINEIVVRGEGERLIHLDIKIGDKNIARYSGDGVLVCTPAGSTAYNYSLGGVIVDPNVDMLQITPIAPVNNIAYRSITSGIIVPTQTSIELVPVNNEGKKIAVIEDGAIVADGDIKRIVIHVADKKARIVRFRDYSFWGKVKDKIIG
ncbi:MAG: NAD(+)/NADH kinase [Firmicutes bacterium]|nr:NAD(+)/NADH kinase [Bacillota bacterium]